MDEFPSFGQFLTVIALVAGNGYFVAAEFAIVRARPTRLKEIRSFKAFGTSSSLKLIEELDKSLSATQLGITVMSLILGWKGERIMSTVFHRLFDWLPPSAAAIATHSVATAAALVIITVLHVVIGELAAKSIAIRYPEITLRILAPSMVIFSKVCAPALYLFTGASNLFLACFGIKAVTESERVHSSGELSMLIEHSTEFGILDKEEGEMLKGVFSFGDTVAREVMTPRMDVVTVPASTSLPELLTLIRNSRHSRFPVVGEHIDDVLGVLLARDVLSYMADVIPAGSEDFNVRQLMRSAYFIPGTKPIDDLLSELKRRNQHLSVVLDEHGGMDGVVTLEDLIEEIFGEIFDESDLLEKEIIEEGKSQALLHGGVLVADLNQKFSLSIEEGDYDTIAGFIFSTLGRMAENGDSLIIHGSHPLSINGEEIVHDKHSDDTDEDEPADAATPKVEFVVEKVVGNRIDQVRMRIHEGDKEKVVKEETA